MEDDVVVVHHHHWVHWLPWLINAYYLCVGVLVIKMHLWGSESRQIKR